MIREFEATKLDDIDPLITRFMEQSEEGAVPPNFSEQIKDAVSKDRACLYGDYDENGSLRGIGLFGKVSSRISFVFADGNQKMEQKLVSTLFDRFSSERSFITTGGPWIDDAMSQYIVKIGFERHDREHMTLARTEIEKLPEPELPADIVFDAYTESHRDEIAALVYRGNEDHVDQNVFPDFFGTPEDCKRLLENIENHRYGDYKEQSSWILRHDGVAIGVCFMTIRNGEMGYIPDIVIEPSYRGRGLGKAILVYSMKRQAENETSMDKINLDVTLSNNAYYLYQSLGFHTIREYTLYTWRK
jgi:ribosomal protein S18 acetylase RimI-like enzyme